MSESAADQGKSLTALYPVIAVEQPVTTAAEFRRLFGLETVFETDWYVHLKNHNSVLQIGFVQSDHESIPTEHKLNVCGTFVTIDAIDVAVLWEQMKDDLKIIVPLTDESWGQRHFIAEISGGVLVDIVQLLPQE